MPFCQRRSVAESLDRELSKPSSLSSKRSWRLCSQAHTRWQHQSLLVFSRADVTIPPPRLALSLRNGGIKDESCRKRRWWTCVPIWDLWSRSQRTGIGQKQWLSIYSSLFNVTEYNIYFNYISWLCSIWRLLIVYCWHFDWLVRDQW